MNWETRIIHSAPGQEQAIPNVHPATLEAYGYYPSAGLPKGQYADYRRALPDGRGIHVKLYDDHATAHLDRVDPSVNLIGHLLLDAPVFTLFAGLALASIIGGTATVATR